ncbi:MAG: Sec-independent protein translocase protein TatB [Microthrixaceae bacterium]
MFNVGGGEFLVIALVALIVLGPQRLPDAARQVGKALGELRRLSSGFQDELRGALSDADSEADGVARPAESATRRDVLSAAGTAEPADAPADSPAIAAAVAAVSRPPAARRTPLRAAPARRAPLRANADPAAPARRAVPKASPPGTNGS